MSYFEQILLIVISMYILFCQEQMLFYKDMKKYCKKHQGNCKNCSCWSCPRKLYIDEYKINRG